MRKQPALCVVAVGNNAIVLSVVYQQWLTSLHHLLSVTLKYPFSILPIHLSHDLAYEWTRHVALPTHIKKPHEI